MITIFVYRYKSCRRLRNCPQNGHWKSVSSENKLFKLDEPDMQDTAGEAEMNS